MALWFACVPRSVCCVLGGWLISFAGSLGPAAADGWPANVRAVYQIDFNGFNVGTFEFRSQADSESYTLSASARFSILLGAFTWSGETRSFGMIVNAAPKPASFSFDYRSNLRTGSTKLGFSDGGVTDISNLPPTPATQPTIPVREYH